MQACGAVEVRERAGGVAFGTTLESAYRACLWSRIANRVYLEVAQFEARDTEEFYAGVAGIDWSAHLAPGATLACEFSGKHPSIDNTHFGALKLKDGIVDALRAATGARPDIVLERPDVRVHAHAHGSQVTVSLDLSGESLHRRGYRGAAGEAPLKENVAAAVLMRSQWPELAAQGAEFLDPLCGSGTFCIEAALMATNRAPDDARVLRVPRLARSRRGTVGRPAHAGRGGCPRRQRDGGGGAGPGPQRRGHPQRAGKLGTRRCR